MRRNTFKKGFKPYYAKHTYVCGLVTKWEFNPLYKVKMFPNKHFRKWEYQAAVQRLLNIHKKITLFTTARGYYKYRRK